MIIRKPYAFLIKYFKIFHIIMFIFFGYFVFVLRKIYSFFSAYVKSGNFTYFEDITSRYIPTAVFFMLIILIGMAIGILLLMQRKDKPVVFYKLLIGYSSVLLIAFIYFFAFFKSLDDTVYEPLRIVVNRDIILFLYLINFAFVVLSFIRGFGFDIKKFSFEKDKKELNLEESDNEEYELNVGVEKEEIVNYLHKQKREFKYYLRENSLVLSIAGGALLLGLIVYVILNFFVINRIYHEGDSVNIGKLTYVVNSSRITNVDKYGKELDKNNDYLIVNIDITNMQANGHLDKQAFRVHIDDEYYYPLTSSCDMFDDVGECYNNQELKVNTSHNYILAYKIKKEHRKIYLEILKNKGDNYNYSRVSLSYKEYERVESNYKINDTFKVNGNEHQVLSYEFTDKTTYQYQECVEEKCNNYIKTVMPKTGEVVLILEITNLDKLDDNIIKSSLGIKYNNKKLLGSDIKVIDRHENKVYLSVNSSMKTSTSLTLVVTTRENIYNINLIGG